MESPFRIFCCCCTGRDKLEVVQENEVDSDVIDRNINWERFKIDGKVRKTRGINDQIMKKKSTYSNFVRTIISTNVKNNDYELAR